MVGTLKKENRPLFASENANILGKQQRQKNINFFIFTGINFILIFDIT